MTHKKVKKNRYKKSRAPKKGQGRKILRRVLIAAGFLVSVTVFAILSILVHDLFTQSPFFNAEDISIEGRRMLTEHEILDQAGLEPGVNILSISLKKVRLSLESHPWIAKAQVGRDLPNRLNISITEREAMAVLNLGSLFLMDVNGQIFKRCSLGDPPGLPIVEGLKFSDISVAGEQATSPFQSVVDFLQARRKHGWALPASAIDEIVVDRDIGLTLVTKDPELSVRMGYENYPEKLMRLNYVLFNSSKKMGIRAAVIDIVDVDRVVVRPREEV